MFDIGDLKQTRFYQEARKELRPEVEQEVRLEVEQEIRQEVEQEVRLEVEQEVRQEVEQEVRLEAVLRFLALGLTVEQIAEGLGLSVEQVRLAVSFHESGGDSSNV